MPSSCMLAAPRGQSGKTIISTGICAAFVQRGLIVQPFKKGPDYIDPSWLTAAANRSCRSLDTFMMSEETCAASFHQASRRVDLALIEGAMGLYDSPDSDGRGSNAHIARLLKVPVILVVNATRMTRSIAAMVMGYQKFEPETDIAGVILNSVSGIRHEQKLRAAIEQYCGIPVLGGIPRDTSINITQRHLGIVPQREAESANVIIDKIRKRIEEHLDLEGILTIAKRADISDKAGVMDTGEKDTVVKIGVMFDKVFTFYYPENLEALACAGAELVYVDSLKDQELPEIDGLFLGGGFPELFLEELEANKNLRDDIAEKIESGLPVYAECAGLMYLCKGISWNDRRREMVGVIDSEIEVFKKPQGHGYVEVEVTGENPIFPAGLIMRGHEFHYSRLSQPAGFRYAYRVRRGHGVDGKVDAIIYKNVFASYTHLHALGVPQWAENFVSLVLREKKNGHQ